MIQRPRSRLVVARVALLGLLPLVGACGGRTSVAGSAKGSPILLVSIDTLRSDRLPVYGASGVETPALSALAQDGVVFEHVYSTVPLTLPSHSSMLTGQLPGEHGVRDNLGYRLRVDKRPWLPRLLHEAGFATGGAVSAFVLRAETGIGDGFDFFDSAIDLRASATIGDSQRGCRDTLASAAGWLDSVRGKPYFFLYHLYEPHTPYTAPEPFASRYPGHEYEAEIATADACVGELLDRLRRDGVYDRATILVTSDHGEGLGEHGEAEHGIFLYREALQVPLIVKLPGGARGGERVAAPATLVDILPTVAELVGATAPAGSAGVSLLGLDEQSPARPIYSESYYARLHLGWNELASVIDFPHHAILGPDPELYQIARDPAERDNLREQERRIFSALRDAAAGFHRPLAAPAAEDAETAAKLAALGYLGGATLGVEGPLADPKSKIDTLRDYGRALNAISNQNFPLAAELCEKLTVENPYMVDAWENLGIAQHRLGRFEPARRAYERAMHLSGGVAHVAIALGHLLLDLERLDEAAQHARLALDASPSAAHSLLAEVAIGKKDLDGAEREARLALAARGSRVGPLLSLAQVLRERDRLGEALQLTDDALRELAVLKSDSKHPGLYFVRGDLFARQGQAADAEAAFLREIELFPADARSYTRLAALYASAGEQQRSIDSLRLLVERNPRSPSAWAEAVKALRVLGDPAGANRLLAHARGQFPGEPILDQLR